MRLRYLQYTRVATPSIVLSLCVCVYVYLHTSVLIENVSLVNKKLLSLWQQRRLKSLLM